MMEKYSPSFSTRAATNFQNKNLDGDALVLTRAANILLSKAVFNSSSYVFSDSFFSECKQESVPPCSEAFGSNAAKWIQGWLFP